MKAAKFFLLIGAILFLPMLLLSFSNNSDSADFYLPYRQAGLTDRQAAAHLLSRFTFGAKPGQVDEVVSMGLEKWFHQQLSAGIADTELPKRLAMYEALQLNNVEIVNTYVRPGQVLRMAVKEGFVNKDSVAGANKGRYREAVEDYMQQKGLKSQKELLRQLANQKVIRAVYSNNQLQELLTDFWFNHFNVSITKNACAPFIPNYERDVIRPNVLGKFEDLLLATAKSPAMLIYLDNFSSSAAASASWSGTGRYSSRVDQRMSSNLNDSATTPISPKTKSRKKNAGLNENYAREVMELHTLGVEGGYTQNDVTQAARVLTGWTVYPGKDYVSRNAIRKLIEKSGEERLAERGFVHDGDFLFAANRHDRGGKLVLGKNFKPGGGYEEGVELLRMLARHPSTANFISKKIAIRFVSDNPSPTLVDKMAKSFREKNGDIKQVLLTMVHSGEFWSREVAREKIKSPFELAISAVRSLNADISIPYQLYSWVDKMGQKLYYYHAPNGYPDKGQYWINPGALLNRMNFGLALTSGRIPGIRLDLLNLNGGHEPEAPEAALNIYGKIIMPERDLRQTTARLTPLLHDPQLQQKVESQVPRGGQKTAERAKDTDQIDSKNMQHRMQAEKKSVVPEPVKGNSRLSQVVGILIGSPEFQRR